MCARFELKAPAQMIAEIFPDDPLPPDAVLGEYRPTNRVPTHGAGAGWRMLDWGIPAPWDGKPIINARAETVAEKPTFRPYLEGRLVVPATAYFEWRKSDHGKLKNRIGRPGFSLFLLAAIGDGKRFAILTCQPAPAIAHIHNRMPVMLGGAGMKAWLSGAPMTDILRPFAGSLVAEEEQPAQPRLF